MFIRFYCKIKKYFFGTCFWIPGFVYKFHLFVLLYFDFLFDLFNTSSNDLNFSRSRVVIRNDLLSIFNVYQLKIDKDSAASIHAKLYDFGDIMCLSWHNLSRANGAIFNPISMMWWRDQGQSMMVGRTLSPSNQCLHGRSLKYSVSSQPSVISHKLEVYVPGNLIMVVICLTMRPIGHALLCDACTMESINDEEPHKLCPEFTLQQLPDGVMKHKQSS